MDQDPEADISPVSMLIKLSAASLLPSNVTTSFLGTHPKHLYLKTCCKSILAYLCWGKLESLFIQCHVSQTLPISMTLILDNKTALLEFQI